MGGIEIQYTGNDAYKSRVRQNKYGPRFEKRFRGSWGDKLGDHGGERKKEGLPNKVKEAYNLERMKKKEGGGTLE